MDYDYMNALPAEITQVTPEQAATLVADTAARLRARSAIDGAHLASRAEDIERRHTAGEVTPDDALRAWVDSWGVIPQRGWQDSVNYRLSAAARFLDGEMIDLRRHPEAGWLQDTGWSMPVCCKCGRESHRADRRTLRGTCAAIGCWGTEFTFR